MLIYDAVEIKFTVVISLLEWPSSLSTQRCVGKTVYLPVHGEQTESFVACFSHDL